jgi:hypothetical protein
VCTQERGVWHCCWQLIRSICGGKNVVRDELHDYRNIFTVIVLSNKYNNRKLLFQPRAQPRGGPTPVAAPTNRHAEGENGRR